MFEPRVQHVDAAGRNPDGHITFDLAPGMVLGGFLHMMTRTLFAGSKLQYFRIDNGVPQGGGWQDTPGSLPWAMFDTSDPGPHTWDFQFRYVDTATGVVYPDLSSHYVWHN